MTETTTKTLITEITGTIASPKGFHADGQHVGIKDKNKDLGWVVSDVPASVAGVFTTNKVQAAPVQLDKEVIKGGLLQAIIVNSGNANAVTGAIGLQHAKEMQTTTANALNVEPAHVAVCSTGIIGQVLPIDTVKNGINSLTIDGDSAGFAQAIMTTDTLEKNITVQAEIAGKLITMSGVAKGSGMIHPNMATMLGFVTTDAKIDSETLQNALSTDVEQSFNQITIDGDTSTNDTVLVMANGLADNDTIQMNSTEYIEFTTLLHHVTSALAKDIANDGEGATKLLTVTVNGSLDSLDARMIAKKVVGSSLVKTAMFGQDPNWGRIIAAIGATDAVVDPNIIDIDINHVPVMIAGAPADFDVESLTNSLAAHDIDIDIDMHLGNASGTAWGSDLTYKYVEINALYHS
jgi:glutamate N-acetyltransferase/amino-acid N-acetyltransferase